MRKLFFILTLLLFHFFSVKAQELIQEQFDYEGATLQEWIVPDGVSFITLNAVGAMGGTTQVGTTRYFGGGGAQVIGDFPVAPRSRIIMLVGGIGSSNLQQAGGGGGTFVFIEDNSSSYILPNGIRVRPLVVAGGGGGAYLSSASGKNDANGNSPGSDLEEGNSTTLSGGINGYGGEGADPGGGGGLFGDGTGGGTTGGKSILYSLGEGGVSTSASLNGGFGGGGAGYPGVGSGGGGGWSGGAAGVGERGGGGGSYNSSPIADTKDIIPGGRSGNFGTGRVVIGYYVTVLPLKLGSFSAHLQSSGIMLRWNTSLELNASHFEVEKSSDGRNFLTIGQVAAAGNSNTTKAYSFTDSRPLSGVNHYRLKMVDSDGRFTYSKIVVIRTGSTNVSLQLFPNPATTTIQLQTAIKGSLTIFIYDTNGKQVSSVNAKGEGAATSLPINVSTLKKGIYYIKVQGEHESQTASFMKN